MSTNTRTGNVHVTGGLRLVVQEEGEPVLLLLPSTPTRSVDAKDVPSSREDVSEPWLRVLLLDDGKDADVSLRKNKQADDDEPDE